MAKQATLTTITATNNLPAVLNANFLALNTALNNTLSLDGSTPNAMEADIDLNSNDLLNAQDVKVQRLFIANELVNSVGNLANWAGVWTTATSYETFDLVYTNNTIYRAIEDHTSDVFADDLTAELWEVYIDAGLIDQSDVSITGGTITGITDLAVEDGGTGASDEATARTNLGLEIGVDVQEADETLQDIADLVLTAGDILYFDGTELLVLPIGTDNQILRVNSAEDAPEWTDRANVSTVSREETSTAWSIDDDDLNGNVVVFANNASNITITVPSGLTNLEPMTVIRRGAGTVTFVASGTTINSKGGNLVINGQHVGVTLIPEGSDAYTLVGDLTT